MTEEPKQIRLPGHLHARLAEAAKEDRRGVAAELAVAVEEWLAARASKTAKAA